MCNPALIMVGASVLGGAMQGSAQREAANADARAAETNAVIADIQAEQAKQIGNIEETRVLQNTRRVLGAQRAAFGAGNVDPSSGTALDLQTEAAAEGQKEAEIARTNAMRQAWGYQTEATQLRQGAKVARRTGVAQQRSTLLTTAANAYSSYKGYS